MEKEEGERGRCEEGGVEWKRRREREGGVRRGEWNGK